MNVFDCYDKEKQKPKIQPEVNKKSDLEPKNRKRQPVMDKLMGFSFSFIFKAALFISFYAIDCKCYALCLFWIGTNEIEGCSVDLNKMNKRFSKSKSQWQSIKICKM